MFASMFTCSLMSTYLVSLQFTRPKHVEFDVAVNKCLRTDASSWSFLLLLNQNARNHEFKIIQPVVLYGCENWSLILREETQVKCV
jgi:hypothetical protein